MQIETQRLIIRDHRMEDLEDAVAQADMGEDGLMEKYRKTRIAIGVILLWAVPVLLSAQVSTSLERVVEANNRFAFEMYDALASDEGNLFFSPLSISTTFSLLHLGAAGRTAEQMGETFHFDSPRELRSGAFSDIQSILKQIDDNSPIDISMDSALWLQEGFPVHEDLIGLTTDSYDMKLFPVDYGRDGKRIFRMINRYAREKSRGLIPSVLEEPLNPDSLLTLLNVIYFKGEWQDKFKKSETRDRAFHVTAREAIDVPFMHQKNVYAYGETADAQIVALPYADDLLSMMIFLPKETGGLPSLEKNLTTVNLSMYLSSMEEEFVDLYLPRFEIADEFDLEPPLKQLGTMDAFDPHRADFIILDNPPANQYLDFARHGSAVKVNESGSEATAVTSTGGCFPAGTPVMTAGGLKPIESISPGTEVVVFDFSSETWTQSRVSDVHRHDYRGDMITIRSGETEMEATGNHPFYVLSGEKLESRHRPEDVPQADLRASGPGRWVEARELRAGDVLMGQTDGGFLIDAVRTIQINQPVYNLSIEEHRNYAVTERAVLVHNKGSEEARGISFVADHPFAFLIRENSTGSILFMGRLEDPRE